METCKNCGNKNIVKNGVVREKQRYKCKECSYNFVAGDGRVDPNATVKRAFMDHQSLGSFYEENRGLGYRRS